MKTKKLFKEVDKTFSSTFFKYLSIMSVFCLLTFSISVKANYVNQVQDTVNLPYIVEGAMTAGTGLTVTASNLTTCQLGVSATFWCANYSGSWSNGSFNYYVNDVLIGSGSGTMTVDLSAYMPITSVKMVKTSYSNWSQESINVNVKTVLQDIPTKPTTTTSISYDLNAVAVPLSASLVGTGTSLKWYTSQEGKNYTSQAPTPSTSTLGTVSYWVAQANASGCESERVQINVITTNTVTLPYFVDGAMTYGSGLTVTASNLTTCQLGVSATFWCANYGNGVWSNGSFNYYVNDILIGSGAGTMTIDLSAYIPITSVKMVKTSTANWNQESIALNIKSSRDDVPVEPNAATTVSYSLNQTPSALSASLVGTGTVLKWYSSQEGRYYTSVEPIPSTNALGTTSYWVAQANALGCESKRVKIDVVVTQNCEGQITDTTVASSKGCYKWSVNDSLYTQSGVYEVEYIGESGCTEKYVLDLTITVPYAGNASEILVLNALTGLEVSNGSKVDFGTVSSATSKGFIVCNIGSENMELGLPSFNLSNGFELLQSPNSFVPGCSETSFTIVFIPSGTGVKNNAVVLPNSDANESRYKLILSASIDAPVILVKGNGSTIKNGSTTVASQNGTKLATYDGTLQEGAMVSLFNVENKGIGTLRISSVNLSGSTAFSLLSSLPIIIPSGASAQLSIAFTPNSSGIFNSSVVINSNDATTPVYTFNIRGTAQNVSGPEINILGNSLEILNNDALPRVQDFTDFGSGISTPVSKVFKIRNQGTSNLLISNVSVVGSSSFSFVSLGNYSIAPGQYSFVKVQFSPIGLGSASAEVIIANNDADESSYQFTIQANNSTPMRRGVALESEETLNVYPNPVELGNELLIESTSEIQSFSVTDMNGVTVMSGNVNDTTSSINTSSLSLGTYILMLQKDNKVETKKFQVIR